jgi:DNA-binding beta-propeller fold protein YncE
LVIGEFALHTWSACTQFLLFSGFALHESKTKNNSGGQMTGLRAAILITAFFTLTAGTWAQGKALDLSHTIPLPELHDGDFDHFAADLHGNRLFVAAEENSKVLVFDLRTNKLLHTLTDLKAPHAILFREDLKKLFVIDGDLPACKIYNSETYQPITSIKLLNDADSMNYDPLTRYLYVVNGGREAHVPYEFISVIDTTTDKLLSQMKIDSDHLEGLAIEKSGPRMYVSITGHDAIGVIDRKTLTLKDSWSIADQGSQNTPVTLDELDHRLFTVTRKPGKFLVLDTDTGKVIFSAPTVSHADDLTFDERNKRIYIAGDGNLDVFKQTDPDHYELMERIPTSFRAQTGFLVRELNTYFIAVPHHEQQSAEIRAYKVLP